MSEIEDLVGPSIKDPVVRLLARIVIRHEDRIDRIETLFRAGVGLASAVVVLLGGILTALLLR